MSVEELRSLYHDGTIAKEAKTEIQGDFVKEFGYASNQQFIQKMKIGGTQPPTPKQFEWLKARIVRDHAYYNQSASQPA